MRPRFSISCLALVIGLCGVAFAALRRPDVLWGYALFSLTLFALSVACLGATFSRGGRRAGLAGAAFLGWGYLLLCFGPWAEDHVRPRLATTFLLDVCHARLGGSFVVWDHVSGRPLRSVQRANSGGWLAADDFGHTVRIASPSGIVTPESYQTIGHSLFALLAAAFGGLVARHFHDRHGGESS